MCPDFNKIDDSEFDWKACLRAAACGLCVKPRLVIDGHQATLTPQGAEL